MMLPTLDFALNALFEFFGVAIDPSPRRPSSRGRGKRKTDPNRYMVRDPVRRARRKPVSMARVRELNRRAQRAR